MRKRTLLILVGIILFAVFLRVYKLGKYPIGFLWDEASLGYNAYSILKTGRDEYGEFLPTVFKSFGDYKPGLYVYLIVPSIAIFGLNEFSVRLPSAIFGTLTVLTLYFLIKEGFDYESTRIEKRINADSFALIASLLLAISPWHVNFSRGAWEVNIMTFELVFGFYLLLRFINSRKLYQLYLAVFVFLLTQISYQSAKFLTPCLLLAFVYFFRTSLKDISRKLKISSATIFLLGFILFSLFTFLGEKSGRIKAMSLFSYPRSASESEMIQAQDNHNGFAWEVFHSRSIFFTRSILGRYFNHFSGKFLFFEGDWSNPRNGVVYQGVLYYVDAIFLLLGLGYLFGKKRNSLDNLMLFWLLLAPLPAALTRDSISSVRSFTMVTPLIYMIALGVCFLLSLLDYRRSFLRYFTYCLLTTVYCLLLIRFLDLYFVHNPIFTAKDRLYGYREVVDSIKPMIESESNVIITTKYGQPYIFYLFYSKFDPAKYQKMAFLEENPYGDVGEVEKMGKIEFRKIYWPDDRAFKNSLFVGDEFDLPLQDIVGQENIAFLKEINYPNGRTAFRIVETR